MGKVDLHDIFFSQKKEGQNEEKGRDRERMRAVSVVKKKERKKRAMAGGLIVKPAPSPVP